MKTSPWDVAVIGGGPAGIACASLLAKNGWKVLLAEGSTYSRLRLADTLCPIAVRRLRYVTGFDANVVDSSVPCKGVVAKWGRSDLRITDYELSLGSLGRTIARPATNRLLFEHARKAGVCGREGWRRIRHEPDQSGKYQRIIFATKRGYRVEKARCVVDASGRAAPLPRGKHLFLDRQLAFATSFQESGERLKGFLWIESTATGWWYTNALPKRQVQLVFLTNSVPRLHGPRASVVFFQNEFRRCSILRELISLPPKLPEVSAYDARLSAAINVGGSTVFHAGDAAATSDPLSGRGWLRALDSAQAAAATASQVLTGSDCDVIKLFRERTVDAFMRHWKVREELKPEFAFD